MTTDQNKLHRLLTDAKKHEIDVVVNTDGSAFDLFAPEGWSWEHNKTHVECMDIDEAIRNVNAPMICNPSVMMHEGRY